MSEEIGREVRKMIDGLSGDAGDEPVYKDDLFARDCELRDLRRDLNQMIEERARWSRYNMRLAEIAFDLALGSWVFVSGTIAYLLAQGAEFNGAWRLICAIAVGAFCYYLGVKDKPARPPE